MPATRQDWKTQPLPQQRAALPLSHACTPAQFARLTEGVVPRQMEDKWFIFYEAPWLHLHRSWTGHCIYQLRFEPDGDGARIVEAWVNRDPAQYQGADEGYDVRFLQRLLGLER